MNYCDYYESTVSLCLLLKMFYINIPKLFSALLHLDNTIKLSGNHG